MAMQTGTLDVLRHQLEDRRGRLAGALADTGSEEGLVRLLSQVDAALDSLGTEDYARCLVCEEHVSEQDLVGNPLLRYCLCDLTREQQVALEHDLALALRIQSALLPDPDLRASRWEAHYRYEPAGPVSGDYCDLWVHPDESGTVFFAVGDVSGKGVAASLLMAQLQATFRSLLGTGMPLAELVRKVDRQLLAASIPTHYATLVCGRATDDGTVEIVNAGHCLPLVVRPTGVEAIRSTGFPIGLLEDKPFEVERIALGEHDSLVLYTDGLTEARRPDGTEYGQERIEKLLQTRAGTAPRPLVQAIRQDLAEFLGDGSRSDDLTVLVLRRANGKAR